jgi:hypothetical protein
VTRIMGDTNRWSASETKGIHRRAHGALGRLPEWHRYLRLTIDSVHVADFELLVTNDSHSV